MVFQSTRPCGARRQGLRGAVGELGVSIHAPVRGATSLDNGIEVWQVVSIHAPVRGATASNPPGRSMDDCFNPRARAGRDAGIALDTQALKCFNPRARAGRDWLTPCRPAWGHEFQSTRPCGARPRTLYGHMYTPQFQSTRPCGARRVTVLAHAGAGNVSIHAPVRGATPCGIRVGAGNGVSIHAPVRGATGFCRAWPRGDGVSIHAPVRGATPRMRSQ